MKFLEDKAKHQALFQFGPGANEDDIHRIVADNKLKISEDIAVLWAAVGTGTAFETEDIFSIGSDATTGESSISVTMWYRQKGLPVDYLVFHRGLGGLSVLNMKNQCIYVIDEDSFSPTHAFLSFDDWYCGHLRSEYRERYGLA